MAILLASGCSNRGLTIPTSGWLRRLTEQGAAQASDACPPACPHRLSPGMKAEGGFGGSSSQMPVSSRGPRCQADVSGACPLRQAERPAVDLAAGAGLRIADERSRLLLVVSHHAAGLSDPGRQAKWRWSPGTQNPFTRVGSRRLLVPMLPYCGSVRLGMTRALASQRMIVCIVGFRRCWRWVPRRQCCVVR